MLYRSNERAKKNDYYMLKNQNKENEIVILHTSDTAAAVNGQ